MLYLGSHGEYFFVFLYGGLIGNRTRASAMRMLRNTTLL